MNEITATEIRKAALESLQMTEEDLGTATIEVERVSESRWAITYGDSCGVWQGGASVLATGEIDDLWWENDDEF